MSKKYWGIKYSILSNILCGNSKDIKRLIFNTTVYDRGVPYKSKNQALKDAKQIIKAEKKNIIKYYNKVLNKLK